MDAPRGKRKKKNNSGQTFFENLAGTRIKKSSIAQTAPHKTCQLYELTLWVDEKAYVRRSPFRLSSILTFSVRGLWLVAKSTRVACAGPLKPLQRRPISPSDQVLIGVGEHKPPHSEARAAERQAV
jgi:hypothetical protein